jgi:hypothetical protein
LCSNFRILRHRCSLELALAPAFTPSPPHAGPTITLCASSWDVREHLAGSTRKPRERYRTQ